MSESLKRKALTNTVWKFAERILAQVISLVVSIIIARILTPDDFSSASLVTIFFSICNVLISGGFNTALIQKKDSDVEDYSTILLFSFLLSIVVYLLLFLLAGPISRAFDNEELVLLIRIMGLTLPITAIKSIWCAYISSNFLFRKFFLATLSGTLISGVLGIIFAYSGFGVWSLVIQQMVNTFIDTIILVVTTRIGIKLKINKEKLKSLLNYSWKILVSQLIGVAYSEISPIIIGLKYNKSDLSYYTKGRLFPNTLSSTINSTLSAVLFPVLSKKQDNKEIILYYTRLFIRLSSYIILPIMVGLFMVSDCFVYTILTEKWMGASYYIKIFCIVAIADVISVGNCETIKAIGRSGIYLIIEIIKKALYFVVIILFLIFSNNPEILSISSLLCAAICLVVNSVPNIVLINYKLKMQIIDLLPNVLITAVMALSVYGVTILNQSYSILCLIEQIFTGIFVYTGLSIITKNKSFHYFIDLLKTRRTANE